MRNKIGILLLFGLLTLSFFFSEKISPPTQAKALSDLCQGADRETCLNMGILDIAHNEPEKLIEVLADFSSMLKDGTLSDDPRLFSPLIHDLGMEMAFIGIDPQTAFKTCPLNFKAGCLHGVVMGYLDEMDTQNPTELFSFCDFTKDLDPYYANCIHGVGHELTAKISAPLNTILELCTTLDPTYIHACSSGVFMEYSTGIQGTGHHTHDSPVGTLLLPCSEVTQNFQGSCYVSLSAYRQYLPGTEDFATTARTCQAVPEDYKNECFMGLAEKIMTSTAENINDANALCEALDLENREDCLSGVEKINQLESVL